MVFTCVLNPYFDAVAVIPFWGAYLRKRKFSKNLARIFLLYLNQGFHRFELSLFIGR